MKSVDSAMKELGALGSAWSFREYVPGSIPGGIEISALRLTSSLGLILIIDIWSPPTSYQFISSEENLESSKSPPKFQDEY